MKILCVGGRLLVGALREAGHEVLTLGLSSGSSDRQNIPIDFFQPPEAAHKVVEEAVQRFRPDWILQLDDSTPLIHLGLENIKIPKAWYAVDTHLHGPWHGHLAPIFDLVFSAQKNQMSLLSQYHSDVRWLPLYFSGAPEFLPWKERAHDISFVGTLDPTLNPARVVLLEELKNQGLEVNVRQGEVQPVYRTSRIVINQSVQDDLNFRFFEAMGCGALLITDQISHSLWDIGEPGRDFLVYTAGDAIDLAEKIRWAMEHPVAAEEIARRGQESILLSHTASHRAQAIVKAFSDVHVPVSPRSTDLLAHLAWTHEYVSRLNLPESTLVFFAAEALRLASAVEALTPGNAWTCLVLARLALEQGAYAKALTYLERLKSPPIDLGLRKQFFFFRALLLAHTGKNSEARQTVMQGLQEFPSDPELLKLSELRL